MIAKTLMLIGCAGLLAAPAAATAEAKSTICHRTGGPARVEGLFQGQIIRVADSSVATHVADHGDVVIPQSLVARFGGSRTCLTDAAGGLYDVNGQPVTGGGNTGGGGWGGGGGGWGGGSTTSGG